MRFCTTKNEKCLYSKPMDLMLKMLSFLLKTDGLMLEMLDVCRFEVGRYLREDPWRNPPELMRKNRQKTLRETPKKGLAAGGAPAVAAAAAAAAVAAGAAAEGEGEGEGEGAALLRAAVSDAAVSAAAVERHLADLLRST